jgi:hypothetical protein
VAVSIGAFLLAWVLWGEESAESDAPLSGDISPPVGEINAAAPTPGSSDI